MIGDDVRFEQVNDSDERDSVDLRRRLEAALDLVPRDRTGRREPGQSRSGDASLRVIRKRSPVDEVSLERGMNAGPALHGFGRRLDVSVDLLVIPARTTSAERFHL